MIRCTVAVSRRSQHDAGMVARRLLASLLLAGLGAGACVVHTPAPTPAAPRTVVEPTPPPSSSAAPIATPTVVPGVPVELYVMSECPFCPAAVEAMAGAMHLLSPHVAASLEFVGEVDAKGLASMHGAREVAGDVAQICAASIAPDRALDFVVCQNRRPEPVDESWAACADENGIPSARLRACVEGPEGTRLLAASFERARSRGVRGTPTVLVAGRKHEGVRTPTAFARAICAASDPPPASCARLAPAVPVAITVLSDSRCKDCHPERQESMLRMRIERPVFRWLDYASPEGRALYDATAPGTLPAVLFDASLEADPDALASFGDATRLAGGHRILQSGAGSWNPRCADRGGCALSECGNHWVCRKESPGKLELFMMSQCHFAAQRVQQLRDLLKTLGPVDLSVEFIGAVGPSNALSSMHGPAEVAEDLRQICAQKRYRQGRRFLQYVACRSADYRSDDWRACTGARTGIDPRVLQRCAEGEEGRALLTASFRRSQQLGIAASPTFVANRLHKFSARDADAIRTSFCEHNQAWKGCPRR